MNRRRKFFSASFNAWPFLAGRPELPPDREYRQRFQLPERVNPTFARLTRLGLICRHLRGARASGRPHKLSRPAKARGVSARSAAGLGHTHAVGVVAAGASSVGPVTRLVRRLGLGEARQAHPPAVPQLEPHFDQGDPLQLIQDLPGSQTRRAVFGLLLQTDPQAVTQKRHQHVRFHALVRPVPGRAHFHLALQGAKGRLGFGQLHVGLPEPGRVALGPMGAQEIRPFGPHALLELRAVPVPGELQVLLGFGQFPLEPAPRLGMAFLQAADRPQNPLALFPLSRAHAAAQAPQVADQVAQPAAAHGPFLLHPPGAAAEPIDFVRIPKLNPDSEAAVPRGRDLPAQGNVLGRSSIEDQALKGRHKMMAFLGAALSGRNALPALPRALPWAGLSRAFGLQVRNLGFVGFRNELHLHFVGDFLPVALQEFLFAGLELALGCAYQIVRATPAEQFEVLLADDAAVKDPEAAGFAELLFERVEDGFERRAIHAIAGEDFVSEREALGRDDQRQDELFAVGPVIARVTALGLGHGVPIAREIGAGQIVEQQIEGRAEEVLPLRGQMLFQGGLVGEQAVPAR